jgi:hypothetical protein
LKKFLARFVRQSPAMVVAMIALFVALTGTAVATTSALITGKQIKNNSITGLDIKNKSIGIGDLATRARGARGIRGVAGPPGPAGPAGPAGAPNPNAANSDKLDNYDSSDFVRKAEVSTGYFSCAGTAWQEADSAATFALSGSDRYTTSAAGNAGLFRCSVDIPHGATVTNAAFSIRDTNAVSNVSCALWRTDMATTVGAEQQMAAASSTATPGSVRINDATIVNPGIDNASFSYFVQCRNGATDSTNAIFGTNITYTVTGGQGATAALEAKPMASSSVSSGQ